MAELFFDFPGHYVALPHFLTVAQFFGKVVPEDRVTNEPGSDSPDLLPNGELADHNAGLFFFLLHFESVGDDDYHDGDNEGAPDGHEEYDESAQGSLRVVVAVPHRGNGHQDEPQGV